MAEPHPLFLKQVHREEPYLTIGQVAAISGASPKAIRLYEARGLIPPAARRGKYRIYSERDVFIVHVLKHAQSFGFRLDELRDLVSAKVSGKRFPLAQANALFDRKRDELAGRIAEIEGMLRELEEIRSRMNGWFGA